MPRYNSNEEHREKCVPKRLTGLAKLAPERENHHAIPNYRLLRLLKQARTARDLVEVERSEPLMDLAKRMKCKKTRFARLVRLNYLAPDIITSILDGTQPPDLTARKLMQQDIPMDWTLQRKIFRFAEQPDYLKANIGY